MTLLLIPAILLLAVFATIFISHIVDHYFVEVVTALLTAAFIVILIKGVSLLWGT